MKKIALDLDGTIYSGKKLISGSKKAIDLLLENEFEIYFTTNNSSQTIDEISFKLESLLNINVKKSSVITPLVMLSSYLLKNNQIPIQYIDNYSKITMQYPYNPNNSMCSAAGVSSEKLLSVKKQVF